MISKTAAVRRIKTITGLSKYEPIRANINQVPAQSQPFFKLNKFRARGYRCLEASTEYPGLMPLSANFSLSSFTPTKSFRAYTAVYPAKAVNNESNITVNCGKPPSHSKAQKAGVARSKIPWVVLDNAKKRFICYALSDNCFLTKCAM